MEIKKMERGEANRLVIDMEVSAEEFDKEVNTVYKKNRNSIAIPGFRKGKAPRKIIESMYGKEIFYEDAINASASLAYTQVLEEKELRLVATPVLEEAEVTEEGVLQLTMAMVLYPEVELGEYTGVEVEYERKTVEAAEIDSEIEKLRNRNSTLVTVERESRYGDIVVIDYEGFVDGEAFAGGAAEGHSLEIGSNSFIAGFEIQCIGAKAGTELDVNVTFPEDYRAEELKGKAAVFKVKVHEVKERQLPELDDEFAKDVSEYDTLEEYRNSIRESLAEKKEEENHDEILNKVLDKLREEMKAEVPEEMIEERYRMMLSDYERRISGYGMDMETYLEAFKIDRENMEQEMRQSADKQVRNEIILNKVIELEKITVDEEYKEREYEKVAKSYGVKVETAKEFFNKETFEESCLMTKAADYLVKNAKVEPVKEREAADE